jgi:tungstate transport system permease protein
VNFIDAGLRQALHLLAHPTPDLISTVWVSLRVALGATVLALIVGLPLAAALGLGRFRGRTLLTAVANTGLGLPPVVVGLVVALLLFRGGPLGSLHLIYTVPGMVFAQTVLDLPIIIALVVAALLALDAGLIDQARALGADRWQIAVFALTEARVGVLVAVIAAVGAGLSEVGAVVLVGGNVDGQTRTMAGTVLTTISEGNYAQGIAVGILLLALVLVLTIALTLIQRRGQRINPLVRSAAGAGR